MSVNKPGLPKLNMQKTVLGNASFKTSTATKLASSTRTGYGVMAQRTKVGTGAIFNVKAYNSDSISAQTHALNDNRTRIVNNNILGTPVAVNNSNTNKFAAALMATSLLAQAGAGIINAVKSNGASSSGNAQSVSSGAAGVINDLATAKNSSEIQNALAKLETEMKDYEAKMAKAEETIQSETKLKSENETKLKDTENQIQSEKQNITKQEGTITKLQSSIQSDKMTLNSLKSQLSTAGDLSKMAIQSQISELEAKIEQEEQQLKQAEESKANSQKNLETLENTKKDLTTQIDNNEKNIKNAEGEKNSAATKKDQLEEAKVKYTKKLSETQSKETKELSKLFKEIGNYAKEFQETTDANKKNKLSEKYAEKAKEYNELVRNSTAGGYTEVSLDLNNS